MTVEVTGKDRYGRTLGHVILSDETNLNRELVRRGYAWWFRWYSDDLTLQALEASAKEAERGLWSEGSPTTPWDWRAAQRAGSDTPPSEIPVLPNGVQILSVLPNPRGRDAGNEQVTIRNRTGKKIGLKGWKLLDKAGNVYLLEGKIAAGQTLTITMTAATMPLNNDGDTMLLLDAAAVGRSRVVYEGRKVRPGGVIHFKHQ